MIRAVRVLLAVCMAGTAPLAALAETGVSDKEILIGSCVGLTEHDVYVGTQTIYGAKAYLETVNAQGGVHGRKIRHIAYDHQYDPDKAIECFNKLLAEQVFATAFMTGSPTAAKMAPMAQAAKVPMVGLNTGAEFLSNPVQRYIINVKASYQDEAMQMAIHLWKELGLRKIAVAYQNDAVGATGLMGVNRGLAKFNAAVVATGTFERGSTNVGDAIKSVENAGAEAVFLSGMYESSAAFIKQSKESGWSPTFVGFSGTGQDGFIKAAGSAAEGTLLTVPIPLFTETQLPLVAKYAKAMKKYYPQEQLNQVSLEGFIDAVVLVEGLKRAGTDLTREKLIDAIEAMHDVDIGLGDDFHLHYGPEQHKGFNKVNFVIVRNGQMVPLTDWKTVRRAR